MRRPRRSSCAPRRAVRLGAPWVWTLVGSMCFASIAPPRLAFAAPPAESSAQAPAAGVHYDLSAIADPDDADALRSAIQRAIVAATDALAARGTKTDAVSVKIRIEPAKAGFRATLEGSAGTSARKDVEIACIPCSESELVESIRGRYESLASDLASQAGTDTTATTSDGDETSGASTSDDTNAAGDDPNTSAAKTREGRSSRRLGPAGVAGIVALGVGATAVGVGIGLAVKPDEIADPTPGVAPELRSTHTPGYALLGIGGAAIVTGVALVVVDRVKANRNGSKADTLPQAKHDSRRRVHAAPWADPVGGGLVFSGRF